MAGTCDLRSACHSMRMAAWIRMRQGPDPGHMLDCQQVDGARITEMRRIPGSACERSAVVFQREAARDKTCRHKSCSALWLPGAACGVATDPSIARNAVCNNHFHGKLAHHRQEWRHQALRIPQRDAVQSPRSQTRTRSFKDKDIPD
eukprot:357066-Chlamydomonas_euryale.AAC.4